MASTEEATLAAMKLRRTGEPESKPKPQPPRPQPTLAQMIYPHLRVNETKGTKR